MKKDPLHKNTLGYYKYFLKEKFILKCSTISIAEYCVKDDVSSLPLNNLQIIPFNYDHAIKTGEFAKICFDNKKKLNVVNRNIIPNDTKLFSQAEVENDIDFFVTSDKKAKKIIDLLKKEASINFGYIDLSIPFSSHFGILDLEAT